MLEVLRQREFRRLFTAQVVALLGTGLLTVALGLLAYDLAGADAGVVLGTALAIKMVAYVAVAPVVAAVTDRVPRRAVLITADAVRACVALALPFVGHAWQIYALVFVLQAASATFTPAFQSVIPSLLPERDRYTRALSLSRLAYDLEAVLSPLAAAVLLTVISYHGLFLGTVAGFLGSALLVTATPLPAVPSPSSGALTDRILAGAKAMTARPELRALLAMNLVVAAGTAPVLVNTVVYVHDLLGAADIGVAAALGCFGAGSMLVALLVPHLLTMVSDRSLLLAGCAVVPSALTATTALLAVAPAPATSRVVLGLTWTALGAGTSMINTPSARLLREATDESERRAVFTAQFSLSHACFLITYPIAGWIGAHIGHPVATATLTGLATLAALTAARLWPAHRPAAAAIAVR
ncbi:MFS transporter [Nocardia arizonensis]|uniref:MFS transporter n=1 Tax=Nocardia arizonensis TaxID=1141647 RepID=UPI0006D05A49|nr:MFS transporter [Nocardia arizonensis]